MNGRAGGWYEGKFYQRFIEPFLHDVHGAIARFVPPGSTVIDVGSGTGHLALLLARRCARVTGIESSPRMHAIALDEARRAGLSNAKFILGDALDGSLPDPGRADQAIFCFCLHEMDPPTRIATFRRFSAVTASVTVAEFQPPSPWNGFNLASTITESLSTTRHFSNYLGFLAAGGIDAFLRQEAHVPTRRWTDALQRFTVIEAIPRDGRARGGSPAR